MILTKLLISLDLAFWLRSMLAEPRDNVWHGEGRFAGNRRSYFRKNLDASDAADPRLGTRIGLARSRDPRRAIASLKFSGCAGASPHQISPQKTYSRREPRRQVLSPAEGIRFIWRR